MDESWLMRAHSLLQQHCALMFVRCSNPRDLDVTNLLYLLYASVANSLVFWTYQQVDMTI
jgi:hypothetical protein